MHGGAGKGAHGVVVFMGRLVREKSKGKSSAVPVESRPAIIGRVVVVNKHFCAVVQTNDGSGSQETVVFPRAPA
jgi:hypothetical protein